MYAYGATRHRNSFFNDCEAYHMPSICLPTTCMDIALAMPLLRSYTYSFTEEGISIIMKRVAEEVINKYSVRG